MLVQPHDILFNSTESVIEIIFLEADIISARRNNGSIKAQIETQCLVKTVSGTLAKMEISVILWPENEF